MGFSISGYGNIYSYNKCFNDERNQVPEEGLRKGGRLFLYQIHKLCFPMFFRHCLKVRKHTSCKWRNNKQESYLMNE